MLRIGLFLLTNIAVMVVFAVVINILAPLLGFQLTGGSLTGLLVMCFMYGMIGSLISLLLSKWLAKRSTGTQVIKQPTTQLEVWLVETVRRLARQIDSRNQLLDVTERDARKLEVEVARTDSVARGLSASLDAHKRRYAEMVREAYRNYKHNNYLTYLFSSSDFNQVARRITNLREVAAMRERQMEQIVTLSEQVSVERTRLTGQQRALDSVKRSLTTQRTRLQKDSQAARANIKQLSKKEKAALQQKIAREQRLDVAIDELRKLTRGNKEGNTFTAKKIGRAHV